MLSSEGIKNLIVAAGVGIGDQLDYGKLRYHRIVIMTDADVDGAHIRTLLLTLFYRHFPELITKGHLYIAQPPLFSVSKGKVKYWAYNEKDRDAYIKQFNTKKGTEAEEAALDAAADAADGIGAPEPTGNGPAVIRSSSIQVSRFKGLGEMNAEQLWETTMNPENRILLQVTMDNAEKADETFNMLMGDEVPPRKRFIQTHAMSVSNLDI